MINQMIIIVIGILPPSVEIYKVFSPHLGMILETLRLPKEADSARFAQLNELIQ
jgi:hypothetical protein